MRLRLFALGVLAIGLLACCAPALATGGEFKLPDGRAWEMVSPANKHGAAIEPAGQEGAVIQASEAGGAFTYAATGAPASVAQGGRAFEPVQNLAARGQDGEWTSQDIATPNSELGEHVLGAYGSEFKIFTGELTDGIVEPFGEERLSVSQGEDLERTLFARGSSSGAFEPLVTEGNVSPGVNFAGLRFDGATPDLGHVVFSSREPLTSEVAAPGEEGVYEWERGQSELGKSNLGKLQLVSVLPNG